MDRKNASGEVIAERIYNNELKKRKLYLSINILLQLNKKVLERYEKTHKNK